MQLPFQLRSSSSRKGMKMTLLTKKPRVELTLPGDFKRTRSGLIEVSFVTLLRNRPKPLPVSLSLVKAKAEEVAQSLHLKHQLGGGKTKWSIQLHGEAGDVNRDEIMEKIVVL